MNANTLSLQRINELLPALEAAVYDPLVEMMFGETELGSEREQARMHIARLGHCRETTEAGLEFLMSRVGSVALRHEVHALPDEYHHFISIGDPYAELTGRDVIVDPTYLQFYKNARRVDLAALRQRFSPVFAGTRSAITALMRGPDFKNEKACLYSPETRIPLR